MHGAIEALESAGLISELDLLKIEDFQKNRVVKLYENVYLATHEAQLKVQEANSGEIDPFNFLERVS